MSWRIPSSGCGSSCLLFAIEDGDISPKKTSPTWRFTARFRSGAYGWRSSDKAVTRIGEAVREIKTAARKDPKRAAEGAVRFLERLVPAIEHIDSSSGALGSAVNRAMEALVPIIAEAPFSPAERMKALQRLMRAMMDDGISYLEGLGDYWGELCADQAMASQWADELLDTVRMVKKARSSGRSGFFAGTTACLSALFAAGRFQDIVDVLDLEVRQLWFEEIWRVRALEAVGRTGDALTYIEELLIRTGRRAEAFSSHAIAANWKSTRLATFRAIAKKYPEIPPPRPRIRPAAPPDPAARRPNESR
ncbi:MAG: hypothetical protein ACI9BV_003827 [Rhodothermales bacterium]|jgi:hypothetical protein